MRIEDAALPGTDAVSAAHAVAERYLTPALLAHSVRSWCWALGFSEVLGVPAPDRELLAVSALLHDVGLAPEFDAHRVPYEIAGGHVGWVLAAGAGWPASRCDRVVEVVERHNWPSVDPDVDPEGHLLEIATGLDVSGARPDALPTAYVAQVLEAWPRGTFGAEFTACVVEQAQRKPTSQAARLVAAGLPAKLAHHPLER